MFPYKTSFQLLRNLNTPLYLQLSNQFIELIKSHKIPPETKLPSSRSLSELLGVHRKTVVACYDELMLQGWVDSIPKKGTYVKASLPILTQQEFLEEDSVLSNEANFKFSKNENFNKKRVNTDESWVLVDDGISDVRLTPLKDIARTYRRLCDRKRTIKSLSYGETFGSGKLRKVLASYLNKTRGLQYTEENILITRGSQMGIFLASKLLLEKDDIIVVGETNYIAADVTFSERTDRILRVPVDEDGIKTDDLEQLCKRKQIKAVYVTSHHHHPTTVTLSAERRIHLLNLAKEYRFAIVEDDYDYDFNYNHAPILPLASHDTQGNVVYIGSICKTVAPVFRIGYLIGPKDFVEEASRVRRYVDRQGDALLELTFADFIESGDLDRHIKKTLKTYQQRRDFFCEQFQQELCDYFEFDIPKGGMAVWVKLKSPYTWKEVSEVAKKYKLELGEWQRYDVSRTGHNAIRIGFASKNEEEIEELVMCFKKTFQEISLKTSSVKSFVR